MSTLTTVLPALTGFGGTLLGIAVAEARARRDARLSRGSDFAARRKAAYAELWTVVQDAHLEARTAIESFDAKRVADLTLRVNTFCMQNGVFIDDPDRQLATRYLRAVFTLVEAVRRDADQMSEP